MNSTLNAAVKGVIAAIIIMFVIIVVLAVLYGGMWVLGETMFLAPLLITGVVIAAVVAKVALNHPQTRSEYIIGGALIGAIILTGAWLYFAWVVLGIPNNSGQSGLERLLAVPFTLVAGSLIGALIGKKIASRSIATKS